MPGPLILRVLKNLGEIKEELTNLVTQEIINRQAEDILVFWLIDTLNMRLRSNSERLDEYRP